jgi:hypothetical protein
MIYTRTKLERRSPESAWPLGRADGTRWHEKPKPGYNPLGKENAA